MPELGYLIPVTASPELFPNNIQCDSRLASNTPLGSFPQSLDGMVTHNACQPAFLAASLRKITENKKWWIISQGQY